MSAPPANALRARCDAVASLARTVARRRVHGVLRARRALALAADVPFLTGRVVDNAEILKPATRDALTNSLKAHEQATTNQVAVLTVPTINGDSIEEYATKVFENWKLGQKGKDNGVLVIVVPKDRKMRIEVGYGLEGTLTDAQASRIIRNVMTPAFKAGDYDKGVSDGVAAIVATLEGKGDSVAAAGDASSTSESTSGLHFTGPELAWPERILLGAFIFGIIGLFTFLGIMTPGVGWFLYVFLIPFWAMFPMVIVGSARRAGPARHLHRRLPHRQAHPVAQRVVPEGGAGPEEDGARQRRRIRGL